MKRATIKVPGSDLQEMAIHISRAEARELIANLADLNDKLSTLISFFAPHFGESSVAVMDETEKMLDEFIEIHRDLNAVCC